MDEAKFWALIGTDRSPERIRRDLEAIDGDRLLEFHEHLRKAVGALGSAEHRAVDVYWEGDDQPVDSDDQFESVRLAVVGMGEQVWRTVLANPAAFRGPWPDDLDEELVEVVSRTYEKVTGDPWPDVNLHEEPISATLPPPLPFHRWLSIGLTAPSVSQVYQLTIRWETNLLGTDPDLMRWWYAERGGEAIVDIDLELSSEGKRRRTVRVSHDYAGREDVRVRAVLPAPSVPSTAERKERNQLLRAAARADLEQLVLLVFVKLGVNPPPVLLPSPEESLRLYQENQEREAEEHRAFTVWNDQRKSVPRLWRGRVPEHVVHEMIEMVDNGFRRRIPEFIAHMREYFKLPALDSDIAGMRAAAYTEDEIALALGPVRPDRPDTHHEH